MMVSHLLGDLFVDVREDSFCFEFAEVKKQCLSKFVEPSKLLEYFFCFKMEAIYWKISFFDV